MELKNFIILFALISAVRAQFNYDYGSCDYKATLTYVGQKLPLNHAPSRGSCRFHIVAPSDTMIEANCKTVLKHANCDVEKFIVSRSGEKDLRDGHVHCASSSFTTRTIGNEIVIALHTTQNVASFSCTFEVKAIADYNCDCGWVGKPKIVGGRPAAINEYIGHVGLQAKDTKEIFCGGTISE